MPFTIIGELINTTRKKIQKAVVERDEETLKSLVTRQEKNGADYIDINTGAGVQTEAEDMRWLIRTVQGVATVPLCIDSPNPDVLKAAWELLETPPMINSISLENKRFTPMLDMLRGQSCQVIALCMNDSGMPDSVDEICRRAEKLTQGLTSIDIKANAIWIDPLVGPVSTQTQNGLTAMSAVEAIKKNIPEVKTVCGLSNISFGLPARRLINRMFVCLMMSRGLDGAILDPLDKQLGAAIATTEMLLNNDEYCMNFMEHYNSWMIPK